MTETSRPVAVQCILLMLALLAPSVTAQSYGRVEQTQSNLGSYHYLIDPGVPTIRVSVTGPVRYPGVYEVSQGSRLGLVLALSGGPDPGRVEFVNKQRVTVRLHRREKETDSVAVIFTSAFEAAVTDSTAPPLLAEGDVIAVDVAAWRRFDWRDILTIVNVVNTIVLILLAFDSLKK